MATMFTPLDLIKALEQVMAEPIPLAKTNPVKMQEHLGGHEDTFWFFRGTKTDFRDSVHFWVFCLIRQWSYLEPDIEKISQILSRSLQSLHNMRSDLPEQYEEISPDTFQAIVQEYSGFLAARHIPHKYEWHGSINRAMRMDNEWNDVTVIGETESEFVAFEWATGA